MAFISWTGRSELTCDVLCMPLSLAQKSREGGIREGGVAQVCRKLRAKLHICAKNAGNSFRASRKGAESQSSYPAEVRK